MVADQIPHPYVVTEEQWLAERKKLLTKEKELTRQLDALSAERRRLPMVKVEKDYTFEGPEGKVSLLDLFEGQRQLIVYHFMYDPEWTVGCGGCTGFINAMGKLGGLKSRDTRFVVVSRAPLAKLEEYKQLKGWDIAWYSSFGSDFNYDYHVTLDEKVAPIEYNYRNVQELNELGGGEHGLEGEMPGTSVFFRIDDTVYHTYSSFARGAEALTDATKLLDITPYGRQEDWENSPAGWPQKPTYG